MIFGKTDKDRLKEVYKWRKFFAWYPVTLHDGRTAWFEYVERRFDGYIYCGRGSYTNYLYRKIGETVEVGINTSNCNHWYPHNYPDPPREQIIMNEFGKLSKK